MCRAPWIASSRNSSTADQRTSPVWPPRPAPACSMARSTEITMSPRCGRRPGGSRKSKAAPAPRSGAPGCAGNVPGGRRGNDSTSVGRVLPKCSVLSWASSASFDRMSPIEAGSGAPAPVMAAAIARARTAPAMGATTMSRTVRSTRIEPRYNARVTRPGRCLHRHRRRGATPARRPCSAGTRSACGTSPGAARRTPRGSAPGRAT